MILNYETLHVGDREKKEIIESEFVSNESTILKATHLAQTQRNP